MNCINTLTILTVINDFSRKYGINVIFTDELRTCTYDWRNNTLKINLNMVIKAIRDIFNCELRGLNYLLLHEYYHKVLIESISHILDLDKLSREVTTDLSLGVAYYLIQDYVIDHILINDSWYLQCLLDSYLKNILNRSDFRNIQLFYAKFVRNPVNLYMPYHVVASYSIRRMLNFNFFKYKFTDIELRFINLLRDIYESINLNSWFKSIYVLKVLIDNLLPISKLVKTVENEVMNNVNSIFPL